MLWSDDLDRDHDARTSGLHEYRCSSLIAARRKRNILMSVSQVRRNVTLSLIHLSL